MVSNASEDLPEPERPVNTTSLSRGISASMFFRLCSRAPRMVIARWLLELCWRFALITSSISAYPGAVATRTFKARPAGKSGDRTPMGKVQNIGRTGIEFQCPVQTINGLLAQWQQLARRSCLTQKAGTGPASFWLFQRSAEPYCLSIILPENRFPPHIKCGAGFFRI